MKYNITLTYFEHLTILMIGFSVDRREEMQLCNVLSKFIRKHCNGLMNIEPIDTTVLIKRVKLVFGRSLRYWDNLKKVNMIRMEAIPVQSVLKSLQNSKRLLRLGNVFTSITNNASSCGLGRKLIVQFARQNQMAKNKSDLYLCNQ